jgi:aldose sugar dehydrogenase
VRIQSWLKGRRTILLIAPIVALVLLLPGAGIRAGQQKVQFENNIPVAPQGLAGKPLPDKPVDYNTGEGQKIRVSVLARGLTNPWSLAFLPDGTMLVTERNGQLRAIRNGVLDPKPVAGSPMAYWAGESGLPGAVHGYMDLALHPQFAETRWIYLSYTKPIDANRRTLAIARGKWDGRALTEVKDVVVFDAASTARIAFGKDKMLYVTTVATANNGEDAQNLNSQSGKVLRFKDDGTVPPDNPFVGRAGTRPEIYTYGHRSSLGLAVHPTTGEMWLNENGPNGGDEINILKPGKNYGWPLLSFGRTYQGPWQSQQFARDGFEPPLVYWMPSIAVSGMAFYTGDKFPKWKGDVFVGSLRTGEIPGTGHVERILFNEKMEELRRESLLVDLRQRIRDVRQGPDGLLYVLTDEKNGAVLKIEPVN